MGMKDGPCHTACLMWTSAGTCFAVDLSASAALWLELILRVHGGACPGGHLGFVPVPWTSIDTVQVMDEQVKQLFRYAAGRLVQLAVNAKALKSSEAQDVESETLAIDAPTLQARLHGYIQSAGLCALQQALGSTQWVFGERYLSPTPCCWCRLHTAERRRKMQRQVGLLAATAVALAAAELYSGGVSRGYRYLKR